MNFFAPHIMEWNKLDRKIQQSKLFSLVFILLSVILSLKSILFVKIWVSFDIKKDFGV